MPKPVQVFRCIDAQHEDFSTFDKTAPAPEAGFFRLRAESQHRLTCASVVHNNTSTRRSPTTRPVTIRPFSKRILTFCPSKPAAMA